MQFQSNSQSNSQRQSATKQPSNELNSLSLPSLSQIFNETSNIEQKINLKENFIKLNLHSKKDDVLTRQKTHSKETDKALLTNYSLEEKSTWRKNTSAKRVEAQTQTQKSIREKGLTRKEVSLALAEERPKQSYVRKAAKVATIGVAVGGGVALAVTAPFWAAVAGGVAAVGGVAWYTRRLWNRGTEGPSALEADLERAKSSKRSIVRVAVQIRRSSNPRAAHVSALALNFVVKLDQLCMAVKQDPLDYSKAVGLFKNVGKIENALNELVVVLKHRPPNREKNDQTLDLVEDLLKDAIDRYEGKYEEVTSDDYDRVHTSVKVAKNVMDAYAPKNQDDYTEDRSTKKKRRRPMTQ